MVYHGFVVNYNSGATCFLGFVLLGRSGSTWRYRNVTVYAYGACVFIHALEYVQEILIHCFI